MRASAESVPNSRSFKAAGTFSAASLTSPDEEQAASATLSSRVMNLFVAMSIAQATLFSESNATVSIWAVCFLLNCNLEHENLGNLMI